MHKQRRSGRKAGHGKRPAPPIVNKAMKLGQLFAALVCVCALASCGGKRGTDFHVDEDITAPDTLTLHASLLTIAELPESGASIADIRSPWDESGYLARLLLVPRDSAIPEGASAGRTIIRTPVHRAAVFSAVHTSAMNELGALEALVAVADGTFFAPDDSVRQLLDHGKVVDAGSSQQPSQERLIAAQPEVVMLSPMQGQQMPALPARSVSVPMADYLESSPIGRAEWLLLIGKLFGKEDEAAAIFDKVVNDYCDLQLKAELAQGRPIVLVDTEYSGAWYVPAGESYMARMIRDAGATTPWSDSKGTGSLTLNMERVLTGASEADFWLVRTYGMQPTLASVKAINPLNARIKAWREGNVYGCDTEARPLFNDTAFHPERVLADLIAIFHPEIMEGYTPRYYSKAL